MCIATGEIKRPMKEKALLASLMSQGEQDSKDNHKAAKNTRLLCQPSLPNNQL